MSQDFIQVVWLRLFIICLTSDQWSLIYFVTYLKMIHIFIWKMRLENSQVRLFIHPLVPIKKIIKNSI